MNGDSERPYFRPVPCDRTLPGALPLAGTVAGFREIEVLRRSAPPEVLPTDAVRAMYPDRGATLDALSNVRPNQCGLTMDRPRIMGIVNATPDSFSDGGRFASMQAAVDHAGSLVVAGADIIDIGGESTRPGAVPVSVHEETDRVLPVIEALVTSGIGVPVSVDTRNASVARQALAGGARMFNDVSALTHDPASTDVARDAQTVCLMHALGNPKTMQQNPVYDDVLLDVYDYLEFRVSACEMAGISRENLVIDPGIGFGKTMAHNIALIRGLSLLHGLGCPVMLGASRKGFIGRLGRQPEAEKRAPGSISVALAGVQAGAQILRVHDVAETDQAVRVWQAVLENEVRE